MLRGNQQKHLSLSLPHKRGKLNKNYSTFYNTVQIAKLNEIHHSLADIRALSALSRQAKLKIGS